MTIGTASFSFSTKKIRTTKEIDVRVNVKDQNEFLQYNSSVSDSCVGISLLNGDPIDVEKNLLIKNESNTIENNDASTIEDQVIYNKAWVSDHSVLLITDIVSSEGVPFFGWHDLSEEEGVYNLVITDHNGDEVSPLDWSYYDESDVLEYQRKGIYTNLKCNKDSRTEETTLYYLTYRAESGEVKNILLDTKTIYSYSSFDSSSKKREMIIQKRKDSKFDVSLSFDGANYSPTGIEGKQRFFVRIEDTSTISIIAPVNSSPTEKWRARIRPGDFFLNSNRYWVPEYYDQVFNPFYPYRMIREKDTERISNRVFRAYNRPISSLPAAGFYLYVAIKDTQGNILEAFTDDPDADTYVTKNGYVTDVFYQKDIIKTVCSEQGYLEFNKDIAEDNSVAVTYHYKEEYLPYSGVNLNPGLNPDILGKKVWFYCKPNETVKGINHLVLDNSGITISGSEGDRFQSKEGTALEVASNWLVDLDLEIEDNYSNFELEFLSGVNSGKKVMIIGYDPDERKLFFEVSFDNASSIGDSYRITKKTEDYTSETINGPKDFLGIETLFDRDQYKTIGNLSVVQTLAVDDLNVFDARTPGGGVKEDSLEMASKLQQESRWYWGVGNHDGDSYPGMGAVLVKLPRHILKEIGGVFSRQQVEEITMKHMGEGTYPVIEYYDTSTEITKIEPRDGEVTIQWRGIDVVLFNIYIGNSPDNLELQQQQPGTRTETTISGLENNKIYYIQIEPEVGGYKRLRSKVVAFMPFSYAEVLPPVIYGKGKFMGATYE